MADKKIFVLLFGAAKYKFLNNRELDNDVRALGTLFREKMGYRLWFLYGNSFSRQSNWSKIIDEMATIVTADDLVIVYYLGHGIELIRDNIKKYYIATPIGRKGSKKGSLEVEHIISYPQDKLAAKAFLFIFDAYIGDTTRYNELSHKNVLRQGNLIYILSSGEAPNTQLDNHIESGFSLINYLVIEGLTDSYYLHRDLDVDNFYLYIKNTIEEHALSPSSIQFFKHDYGTPKSRFPLNLFRKGRFPEEISASLQDDKGSREDGVIRLGQLLTDSDLKLKMMSKETLEYISQTDEADDVRVAALRTLGVLEEKDNIDKDLLRKEFSMSDFQSSVPDFKHIVAGDFIMGCDNPTIPSGEAPEHILFLSDYWISVTPVTNLQYAFFINDTGYKTPYHWKNLHELLDILEHPVVNVSWYDSMAYCKWLTDKMKSLQRIKPSDIIRLPTEAQWEKAARGVRGHKYPWGNEFVPEYCNYTGSHIEGTTPVTRYAHVPSPYGCYDLVGNTWEWTISLWGTSLNKCYFVYPYNPVDGRENISADERYRRVIRGGGYYYGAECVTGFTRNHFRPNTYHTAGSFRLVLASQRPPVSY